MHEVTFEPSVEDWRRAARLIEQRVPPEDVRLREAGEKCFVVAAGALRV